MKNNLKEIREDRHLTQEELSKKSGVARTIISQLENGSREVITSGTMIKLADSLETSIDTLFLL